jgi:hypothetical protein
METDFWQTSTSDDPAVLWDELWKSLESSVHDRKGPFRTLTVATVRDGAPEARTVVLRAADRDAKTLVFHVDLRSPKAEDVRRTARVAILAYAAEHRLQFRLRGLARVETDTARVEAHWDKTARPCFRTYAGALPPGAPCASATANYPAHTVGRPPTDVELATARRNFGVVVVTAAEIEILVLRAAGHRRLEWRADAEWQARWLAP